MTYPVAGYPRLVTDRPQGTSSQLDSGRIDVQDVNRSVLAGLERLAESYGVTVDIFSGYRTDAYSASHGGFAGDPHSRGIAVDANVGGAPIGARVPASAFGGFGLLSGNQPNFYHGQPDPSHVQLSANPNSSGQSGSPSGASAGDVSSIIYRDAVARGLDPRAVLAVVSHEGGFFEPQQGGHYDPDTQGHPGWSYGPFQLRSPGALPVPSSGAHGPGEAYAWSTEGIDYALDQIAKVAKGKTGAAAIDAIVSGFEKPGNIPGEEASSKATYAQKDFFATAPGPGTTIEHSAGGGDITGAISGVTGAITGPIKSVEDALKFLFSYRFLEIVGGGVLTLLGLYLLARRMGGPSVPIVAAAAAAS